MSLTRVIMRRFPAAVDARVPRVHRGCPIIKYPTTSLHVISRLCFLQVKVMLRICSTLARDTSESSSFLKVDPRKKQITLYDPLTCGGQNVFQKRGNQVPPKMFAFDAVFPQDASQVGVAPPTVPSHRLRQC